MEIRLCEIGPDQVRVHQPLPWDVFSAKGQLLLHRGFVIISETQLAHLLEKGMYANAQEVAKPKPDLKRQVFDPFLEWEEVSRSFARLTLAFMDDCRHIGAQTAAHVDEVMHLGERIVALAAKKPDVLIFEMTQMDMSHYVVAHHLRVAALCSIMAARLEWSAQDRSNVCRCALTMNIAILKAQASLAAQTQPITAAQRQVLRNHGARSRAVLEAMGVHDADWLCAVEEHHPEDLESGTSSSAIAQLVHHADIYLAKVSARAYRDAKPPQIAARELLQDARLDQSLAGTLIKEIGIYPPGSHVKLANGESAVVVRRGLQAHTPLVCSLVNPDGMPLGEPVPRDTAQGKFAITAVIPKAKVMVSYDRAKLFGLKAPPSA
ncbi:HD-GYP domain-containing protein [Noviherbaspirillum pedocola]|uniref:Phosphohydrolase n=1 Tax=Noviherbaspirillum pedocola TaxID=2801341 RepID=A0A934SV71_9BURK|nr:hypothetical protein [Noviherbaspirillum pedocola]MBK4736189.1 hypothetical protein [Noviherbaspirillum pedocola]